METEINNIYKLEEKIYWNTVNSILNKIINKILKTTNCKFPIINDNIIKYMQKKQCDTNANELYQILNEMKYEQYFVEKESNNCCHIMLSKMQHTCLDTEITLIEDKIFVTSIIEYINPSYFKTQVNARIIGSIYLILNKDKSIIGCEDILTDEKILAKKYLLLLCEMFESIESKGIYYSNKFNQHFSIPVDSIFFTRYTVPYTIKQCKEQMINDKVLHKLFKI